MRHFAERHNLINRRAIIAGAAGCLAWVTATVGAKGSPRTRLIGVLSPGPAARDEFDDTLVALQGMGWIEGKSVAVEARSAAARLPLLTVLADDLIRMKVDVIVTYGTEATAAAKRATSTIPIVMASAGDPVSMGLVASLAHPGGNITGYSIISPEIAVKRAALLHELLPRARRICIFINPTGPISSRLRRSTEMAYRALSLEPFFVEVGSESKFLDALVEAARQHADALEINLSILSDAFTEALLRSRVPAMVDDRSVVSAGALVSFAPDPRETTHRLAAMIDKILRGVKPADLPIEQPTRFELVINLRTANTLGLSVPQSLLVRADELIQ